MSDDQIRALERKYRASRDPKDGDAWVQAVLRTTGVPTTALIGLTIQSQRAVRALAAARSSDGYVMRLSVQNALAAQVTPDDIVDFLRGGNNWLEPGMAGSAAVGAASIEAEVDAQVMADILREADSGFVSTAHSRARLEQLARTTGFPTLPFDLPDHNAHIPRRPVEPGDAILCEHANEVPGHCPCEPNCYCRQDGHTCAYRPSDLTAMVRHHEAVDGDVPHNCGDPTCSMGNIPTRRCINESCGVEFTSTNGSVYCSNACASEGA